MFGYVRPALDHLSSDDKERYQSAYCGLCHTIGKQYGWTARLLLNYDFAFLSILLYAGEEGSATCSRKCPIHPFKGKRVCICGDALDLAASESVILTWHKVSDDVNDKSFWAGLPFRLLRLFLRPAYHRAKSQNAEFDQIVREKLAVLAELEECRSPQMDKAADTFASILSAAACTCTSETKRRAMKQLLYHLGRWIYLVDAWDDREEDLRSNKYNPVNARFANDTVDEKEYIETTLTHSVRLCAAAAHLMEFGLWEKLVINVIHYGLPAVQNAVMDGRWKQLNSLREKR